MATSGLFGLAITLSIVGQSGPASPTPQPASQPVGQPVSQPIPRQSTEDQDAKTIADLKALRTIDDARRGPDSRRDEILNRKRLQQVDAGAEDRSPLDVSLRNMQPELMAMPIGFSKVYVDPADPTQYVRADGALFAVFPYSIYKRTKKGRIALIPTSTIFRIGMPAHMYVEPRTDPFEGASPERKDGLLGDGPSAGGRMNTRVNLFLGAVSNATGHEPRSMDTSAFRRQATSEDDRSVSVNSGRDEPDFAHRELPTFLRDESYRRAFFESLRQRRPTGTSTAAG